MEKIYVSAEGLLCGVKAPIASMQAKDSQSAPTEAELIDIVQTHPLYNSAMNEVETPLESMTNRDYFTIDQLASMLFIWGVMHRNYIQLGCVEEASADRKRFLLIPVPYAEDPTFNTFRVWTHSDNAEFLCGGVSHYSGIRELRLEKTGNVESVEMINKTAIQDRHQSLIVPKIEWPLVAAQNAPKETGIRTNQGKVLTAQYMAGPPQTIRREGQSNNSWNIALRIFRKEKSMRKSALALEGYTVEVETDPMPLNRYKIIIKGVEYDVPHFRQTPSKFLRKELSFVLRIYPAIRRSNAQHGRLDRPVIEAIMERILTNAMFGWEGRLYVHCPDHPFEKKHSDWYKRMLLMKLLDLVRLPIPYQKTSSSANLVPRCSLTRPKSIGTRPARKIRS